MSAKRGLSGQRFGYWTVLERRDNIRSNGKCRGAWLCRCDCGNEVVIDQCNLLSGKSKSCGCFRREEQSARQGTHRDSGTKMYNVWCAIKRRCYNTHTKEYPRYGGRGISMCDEWRNSYESFKEWAVNNGYDDSLTIDRIDNDKDYTPDNCRFVTMREQCNNRSSNRVYTYNGETHNVTEWSEIVGIPANKIFCRLYNGWSFERAIEKE